MHCVSTVAVQTLFTPWVHVDEAAHALHGSLPVATLKVKPTWQSPGAAVQIVSTDAAQVLFTPWAHVAVAVHAVHGALPVAALKETPSEHGPALHLGSPISSV